VNTLSTSSLALLENFGHSLQAASYFYQPEDPQQIALLFKSARQNGHRIAFRGNGRSYNDAALNGGGIIVGLRKMNRILEWNPETGVIRAEPGLTLEELWQHALPDGWWPPVVSGTMKTTLGGCLSANIHGKNNYQAGPIGEHVLEFSALLPTGEEVTCSPEKNKDLFHAMISGLGMLGAFTSITLKMKKVYSGLLRITAWRATDLKTHLQDLDTRKGQSDYIVGWLDSTAGGASLGRGELHSARYLIEGEDPHPRKTLQLANQTLPARMFGVIPKSALHCFMTPFWNDMGIRMVNIAKYAVIRQRTYLQSHAAFHFLLDYVPQWELAYGRGGLIQYQSFLPLHAAADVWTELISRSLRYGLPSYLGVTKRHRPDAFLLSHAVDGYSLALDFKVTHGNRAALKKMLAEFDEIVVGAGGRFYFAKNSETSPETARRFLGEATIAKFKELKRRCDPENLLESDLYRRVFGV
jgi:decaprenylphospho-beta-D-ribofuranose 2-oxidase